MQQSPNSSFAPDPTTALPIRLIFTLLFLSFLFFGLSEANADNVGDIQLGRNIAQKECSQCHQVDKQKPVAAKPAPAFPDIAKMESATILSIRVFLRSAHRKKTMPSLILSSDEIDAVATYILSMRPK